jgi:hypothetical protein
LAGAPRAFLFLVVVFGFHSRALSGEAGREEPRGVEVFLYIADYLGGG